MRVALAVSGHGYGHAVRAAEVARALLARGADVRVRSDAPPWLFPAHAEWIDGPDWPLDIGVVQHDGLEFDIDETRQAWRDFACEFHTRADVEAHLLRRVGVDVLLGDIPPLAFAAAARAGIPSYAVANFTWDWIYAAWPDFADIVATIRDGYAHAAGLFRLPLHSDDADAFVPFGCIEDVPLIARVAKRTRSEVRAELGLPSTDPVVLLSFGGFATRGVTLNGLGRWQRYTFVLPPPVTADVTDVPANVRILNEPPADFVSLLAACDVAVTKPGYGIVADCLANQVAVLFTDRGPFREYPVLARALTTLGRARYLPRADLMQAEVGAHLDALLADHTPWTLQPMNGAEHIADRVLDRVTIEQSPLSR